MDHVPESTRHLVHLLLAFRADPTPEHGQAIADELRRGTCELRVFLHCVPTEEGLMYHPVCLGMEGEKPIRVLLAHATMDLEEAGAIYRRNRDQNHVLLTSDILLGWMHEDDLQFIWIDHGRPTEVLVALREGKHLEVVDSAALLSSIHSPRWAPLSGRQERKARLGRAPRP
jgi:hypothetical protein